MYVSTSSGGHGFLWPFGRFSSTTSSCSQWLLRTTATLYPQLPPGVSYLLAAPSPARAACCAALLWDLSASAHPSSCTWPMSLEVVREELRGCIRSASLEKLNIPHHLCWFHWLWMVQAVCAWRGSCADLGSHGPPASVLGWITSCSWTSYLKWKTFPFAIAFHEISMKFLAGEDI